MPIGCIVFVGLVVAWWILSNKKQQEYDELYSLRFPTLYQKPDDFESGDTLDARVWADLEKMILIYEASDFAFHVTRISDLRRLDGPKWEVREQFESWRRNRKYDESNRYVDESRRRELVEGPTWKTADYTTLEVSYQRFIARYRPMMPSKDPVALALSKDFDRDTQTK